MLLTEALPLGAKTARNRAMFGPHETNLAWGRSFSDRHVAYYGARAAGGCGIVVTETASVHETDWPYERCPDATNSSQFKAGLAPIVAECHQHNALVIASLGHSGSQGSSAYSQRELWAPSDEPDVNSRETPKWMELEDAVSVIKGFETAAATAISAGADGVEINAGQNSLIRQFMSGLTNRRDDVYGMTNSPLAFAREILVSVRKKVGDDHVLGLRLCCDELAPWAGITAERGAEIAAALAPLIDYLVVVRGSIFTVPDTRPDGHTEPGFNLDLTVKVRQATEVTNPDLAVFWQGSIVDVDRASAAIVTGDVDGVEMTRAQIADPDLMAKVAAETPEQIRPCTLCNQLCMVKDSRNPIISCTVNSRAGFETIDPDPSQNLPPEKGQPVLIVGGGPAGMEAARVAALRGARVRLLEASQTLGGMANIASRAPGRQRLANFTQWLEAECRRLGVAIRAGKLADPELIERYAGPLILATGSKVRVPDYEVDPGAVALAVAIAYTNPAAIPPGPIAIWDPIGGLTGIAAAEYFLAQGRQVYFITPDQIVGTQLSRTGDLAPANTRLQQAGAVIVKQCEVTAVAATEIQLRNVFTNQVGTVKAVCLIDAGHRLPNHQLWQDLSEDGTLVGDAVAARTIAEAVREGQAAAIAATSGALVRAAAQ